MAKKPLEVLLVEDSESDVFLTKEAIKDAGSAILLHVVSDGVEALEFLRRQGPYGGSPRPDLVLLDLNMPRKDGREVLADVKADQDLHLIPIIVLTTSGMEADLEQAYRLGANCYVVKPQDFSRFREVIQGVERFWGEIASLPPR